MTLDATVGGAAANSYLTVAEADVFASADLGPAVVRWQGATADRKAAALMRATVEIDLALGMYPLVRLSTTQALTYPTVDDAPAGTPVLPLRIKRATYAQAKHLNANIEAMDAALKRQAKGMLSESEPNYSYSRDASPMSFLSEEAQGYLSGEPSHGARVRSIPVATALSDRSLLSTDLLP